MFLHEEVFGDVTRLIKYKKRTTNLGKVANIIDSNIIEHRAPSAFSNCRSTPSKKWGCLKIKLTWFQSFSKPLKRTQVAQETTEKSIIVKFAVTISAKYLQ